MNVLRGRCHICKQQELIEYCNLCQHWFCDRCRNRWFERGLEFIKQLTGGVHAGCCGPVEVRHAQSPDL